MSFLDVAGYSFTLTARFPYNPAVHLEHVHNTFFITTLSVSKYVNVYVCLCVCERFFLSFQVKTSFRMHINITQHVNTLLISFHISFLSHFQICKLINGFHANVSNSTYTFWFESARVKWKRWNYCSTRWIANWRNLPKMQAFQEY